MQPVLTAVELFEKYLKWCKLHRSARTHEWASWLIRLFIKTLPAEFPATSIRAYHVIEWVDAQTQWGQNSKRGAIVAVTRPFNWAYKLGYLDANPLRGVEKPQPKKRDSKLTPEGFDQLLSEIDDQRFRDVLVFAFETGCRPQECRQIEARHVKLERHRVEIPPGEGKVKGRWRIIYLSPLAEAILKRLLRPDLDGRLFRNPDGDPWTANALVHRLGHLKKILGIRFSMYDLRHCFATRKLKEGLDPITVAALLGHKDAKMLCQFYEGISGDGQHLVDAMKTKSSPNGDRKGKR